ncbi:aromatic acid exporter family protein [Yaniella flava]|uniref:Aromatic acid exporter family protein n=1 Tax=Yaniella flava TaxID=287930 RepID=A0ABN2UTJ2_9MICC
MPTGTSRLNKRLLVWLKQPETLTDLLQVTKTVIAATAAWAIVALWWGSEIAFLAPWTAMLTVHATVYRSFSSGIQSTLASAIGLTLSFVVGHFLGVSLATFALALFVGLVAARLNWIRDEGMAIVTTVIFVLASDYQDQEHLMVDRFAEVAIGVAMGIIVNLLIVPPLRNQQAQRYVNHASERMGNILVTMSAELSDSWNTDEVHEWLTEMESMSDELDSAWQIVRFARESERGNPRRLRPWTRRSQQQHYDENADRSYEEILQSMDEGVSHLSHLARTLRDATYQQGAWDTGFRKEWVKLLHETGDALGDTDATLEPLFDRLDEIALKFSHEDDLPARGWPVYGSLLTSLRHIITIAAMSPKIERAAS